MARHSRHKWITGAVAVLLAGTAACTGGGSGDKWTAPGKGQAALLLDVSDTASDVNLAFGSSVGGITIGPDNSVYGLGAALIRIDKNRKVRTVLTEQAHGAAGLLAQSDGTLLFGQGHQVKKVGPNTTVSVLAGASGTSRKPGQPVRSSVSATAVHFGGDIPIPFGIRPDGSVLIADTDIVWALKDGRLSRIYQTSAKSAAGEQLSLFAGSTVDGKGTAYVATGSQTQQEHVGDIITIDTNGQSGKIQLPSTVGGISGNPAVLKLTWLAGDESDGVFARAYDDSGDYVLHIHSGQAELVARSTTVNSTSKCALAHPIDAKKLPCALPYALAYHSGTLIAGGESGYLLDIATK